MFYVKEGQITWNCAPLDRHNRKKLDHVKLQPRSIHRLHKILFTVYMCITEVALHFLHSSTSPFAQLVPGLLVQVIWLPCLCETETARVGDRLTGLPVRV